jgi:hypothetical protein
MVKLGEYLIKNGKLTTDQLATVLERQLTMGGRLGTNLIEMGFLTEEELSDFLSKKLDIPAVSAEEIESVDEEVLKLIPPDMAQRHFAVPFRREKNTLHVAMLDPKDFDAVQELGFISNCAIRPYIAPEARIHYILERHYRVERKLRYISILAAEKSAMGQKEGSPNRRLSNSEEIKAGLETAKQDLVHANNREDVTTIVLKHLSLILDRAVFFVVKRGMIGGWMSFTPEVDNQALRNFEMPATAPSLFKEALDKGQPYVGPFLPSEPNRSLAALLGNPPPKEVLICPLFVKDQPVALLYGDNALTGSKLAHLPQITSLAALGSLALELILIKRKILEL